MPQKKLLRREYFLNRISRESGVPKTTVRKVMNALPNVIYEAMAKCERVSIGAGLTFEGVMKNDSNRSYHSPNTGKIEQSTVFIRPRCIFNYRTKDKIMEAYEKYQEKLKIKEEQQKRLKEIEEQYDYDD